MNTKCKIVLLGSPDVGKTAFSNRYVNNIFKNMYDSTIGAIFMTKTVNYKDNIINCEIWDTAGQERYRSIIPLYYRNANIIIIMFDLSNPDSYESALKWDEELNKYGSDDIIKVIVGNKLDLYDNNNKYDKYFKISVKDNKNIKNLMDKIFSEYIKIQSITNELILNNLQIVEKKKKIFCC